MKKILVTLAAFGLVAGSVATAHATNGMNIEGYGPIALGMGGASYAYDNGTAATMNNPATIGLSEDHRFDIALGFLGPDVTAKLPPSYGVPDAESGGDSYFMPAIGWTSRKGNLSYGIGVFGQGGMGTEYTRDSFMARPTSGLYPTGADTGDDVRSEVSVGRAIVPLAYNVNDKLILGGSLDFVWAGMDIKMAIGQDDFFGFLAGNGGTASGSMITSFGNAVAGGFLNNGTGAGDGLGTGPFNWARFDFSNSSDFTGEARGYGAAGKIGFVYKVNPQFTIGATYHTKTALGDLETDDAKVTFNVNADPLASGTYTATTIPVEGEISVRDFEWPDTFGIGFAYQINDRIMVAADVKQIRWSSVMEEFKMTFTANNTQSNPLAMGFAGDVLNVALFQEWDDQTVIELGGAFKATDMVTLRAGYNHGSNPIPDKYLNALFPAIVEDHITAGLGLDFNEASSLNAALSFALENDATAGSGVISEHSQFSWQLMYTYKY